MVKDAQGQWKQASPNVLKAADKMPPGAEKSLKTKEALVATASEKPVAKTR